MEIDPRNIAVDDDVTVSSEWAIPHKYDRGVGIVIAHGAGNDMRNPLLSYVHRRMADAGVLAVKFNFPYMQRGRRLPDPPARLIRTWRAVVERIASDRDLSPLRLVLSGKSLGGRMASMAVAQGLPAHGLVFFGYPLHPPKRLDKLRTGHLEAVHIPMLFIQGTRDALCDLERLRREVIDKHPDLASLHVVDGADHSFKVPKKLRRSEQSVYQEVADASMRWIDGKGGL